MSVQINLDIAQLEDRLFGMHKLSPKGKRKVLENVIFDRLSGWEQQEVGPHVYTYSFKNVEHARAMLSRLCYGDAGAGELFDVTSKYNGPLSSPIYEALRRCSQFNLFGHSHTIYALVKRKQSHIVVNAMIKAKLEHEPS